MENIEYENDFAKMEILFDNPYSFFEYLKMCKGFTGIRLLSEIANVHLIKPMKYYEIVTFKTFICEIVYNAINLFPDICEYIIKCENENGLSFLKIAHFEDTLDDGQPCLAQYTGMDVGIYCLSLKDIKNFYMNNRHREIDPHVINTLVTLMHMGGNTPKVTTSFKSNKSLLKI